MTIRQTLSAASVQLAWYPRMRVLSSRIQWSRTQWFLISQPFQCPRISLEKFLAQPFLGGRLLR